MTTPSEAVEIYCVKCKAKTGSKDIDSQSVKTTEKRTNGVSSSCGRNWTVASFRPTSAS